MKKALALVMAIAMVASLAAVSFAANTNSVLKDETKTYVKGIVNVIADQEYKWNDTAEQVVLNSDAKVEFGKTVYYNPYNADGSDITSSKAIDGVKLTAVWTEGGEYVKSVEFVKKANSSGNKVYWIAVNTTGSSMEDVAVDGKVYLKGTSGTGAVKTKLDKYFDVDFVLGYADGTLAAGESEYPVNTTKTVVNTKANVEDEVTFKFGTYAEATSDVSRVDEMLLGYSVKANEEVEEAYEEANLDFISFTANFKKTADVVIYAEEGTYLYEIVDGEVVAVDAEYDEWEEAFSFKAKKLGAYVISDMELEVAEEVVVANPSTGAAA